ncbi:MAG: hypothetical protein K2J73_08725 [Oscillospiraceae bacterium]|nr:hypothetical protein [Oscillospiraceae bacterium]
MKKRLTAVLAILLCFAFSSCNESGDVNIAEEIIIDDIETEESAAEITTVTTTSADIISETFAVTVDSVLPKDTVSETFLETTMKTETQAETTLTQISETYGDVLGEITGFHLTLTYPSADGQSADYVFCAINLVTSRIYRIDAGGGSVENESAYLTDNQIKTVMDNILGMSVLPCDEKVTKENACEIKFENSSGVVVNSRVFGEIPEEITKLSEEIGKLAKSDFDEKKFNEMQTNIRNAITNKTVDVYACLHSNIDRYSARGGDTAVYAEKGLIFKSRDEINAAVDFLEEEPVMPIADSWDGYAFVKFAGDGRIEYVNWSETESGLSEKPITYDDCMAYYIENGTVIAFSDYRKQNS